MKGYQRLWIGLMNSIIGSPRLQGNKTTTHFHTLQHLTPYITTPTSISSPTITSDKNQLWKREIACMQGGSSLMLAWSAVDIYIITLNLSWKESISTSKGLHFTRTPSSHDGWVYMGAKNPNRRGIKRAQIQASRSLETDERNQIIHP